MNNFIPEVIDRDLLFPRFDGALLRSTAGGLDTAPIRRLEDRQFLEMHRAFARSGGLAAGDEIARRLRRRAEQPLSTIARWIVDRRIVCIEWQSQTLIPLFQLDLHDISPKPEVAKVVNELRDVFDNWELALWFAQPNAWLDGACPVDAIPLKPVDVLQAARGDRFVALG